MRHQQRTLVVYGIDTYIGREIARFGRAMGHRMVAVVDEPIPEFDEPWLHGIQWVTDTDPLVADWLQGPPAAVIYVATVLSGSQRRFQWVLADRPHRLAQRASQLQPSPRFVLRSTVAQPFLPAVYTSQCRRAEALIAKVNIEATTLRCPILYGPDRADSVAAMVITEVLRRIPLPAVARHVPTTLRVETAALAGLRAALEPDVTGIVEPDDIAHLGDVMIPQ